MPREFKSLSIEMYAMWLMLTFAIAVVAFALIRTDLAHRAADRELWQTVYELEERCEPRRDR